MKNLYFTVICLFINTLAIAQNTDVSKLREVDSLYYINGKLYTGKVYAKHDNGNIGMVGEVKNGRREGTWTFYYSNGKKKRETRYINNKREGLTYYWYENGQLAKEIMYRDDCNIDQKLWYENGKKKEITWDKFK